MPGADALFKQLTLDVDQAALLRSVEGARDVEALCAESALNHFEVCRNLWAFRVIGLVAACRGRRPARRGRPRVRAAATSAVGRVRPKSTEDSTMTEPVRADLSGKTCLVTGASAGIGQATARELARLGARVVMAVRDAERASGPAARSSARPAAPTVELAIVDLSSQALGPRVRRATSARRLPAARRARQQRRRLDQPHGAGAPDGIELTWATNVLGYHLATELLLPLLRRAPAARASSTWPRSSRADSTSTTCSTSAGRTRAAAAYAQSKQADRMLTLGARPAAHGPGVTANALHPGFVATEIFAKGGGLVGVAASALLEAAREEAREQGADTVVYLAASPDVEGRSGLFWMDRQEKRCRFRDEEQEEALRGAVPVHARRR